MSEETNRGRYEKHCLRWIQTSPEALCCVGARSVVELVREVKFLSGKDCGKTTQEKFLYVSSRAVNPDQAQKLLAETRLYWSIEGGLHQPLDVTAKEDASRVRNRNALLILGMARRAVVGVWRAWQRKRGNKRQSTLNDFYNAMAIHQNRAAAQLLNGHHP